MFDIDYFRSFDVKPYYFGLGFIQLKVDETTRFHFYHPEIMPILDEDDIHDHRYSFTSLVEKGCLVNEIFTYDWNFESDIGLFSVSCKKEDAGKEPTLIRHVQPKKLAEFQCSASETYSLTEHAFHRIRYPEPTITRLMRGPIVKDTAFVIKPLTTPAVCPFSKPMEENEIWDVIKKILDY